MTERSFQVQENDCTCGHARSAHHGQGPCLVAVSVIGGVLKDLSRQAEGKVSQGTICPCAVYRPKP
jgi:hypothetical protein